MTGPERPMRADAARNRSRVLEVAYQTFAAEGPSVPIDEIARRAGVGAGTVYRHFATKEALFAAVVDDRVRAMVVGGRGLLEKVGPGEALFAFLHQMVESGATDQGLVEALAGYGIDVDAAAPGAEAAFLELLAELLGAAQAAGTARSDVGVAEVKALLVVAKAAQGYGDDVTRKVTEVITAGLKAVD